jgi:hypothetical protein
MGLPIKGGVSNILADVNANHELEIAPAALALDAGFVTIAASADEGLGIAGGVKTRREVDITEDYRLRIGQDSILFQEGFPGTALNAQVWAAPVATSTVVVAGGFVTLNNGGSLIAAQGAMLRSYKTLPIFTTFPLFVEMLANITNLTFNNATAEWGANNIGVAPGTPGVDGAFFRLTAAGLSCVLANNASEIAEITIAAQKLTDNQVVLTNTNHYLIAINDDMVTYWINDVKYVSIPRPSVGASATHSQQVPLFARQINTSTNTLNPLKLNIALITASMGDMNMDKPWSHRKTAMGDMACQLFTGQTVGKTTAWNSWTALPAQQTSAGTADIGTAGTVGLGGIQRWGNGAGTLALSADTAYIVFKFQIPVLATAAPVTPAKSLVLTGLKISAMTRGAAGPANVGSFLWSMMVGQFQANPATADNVATPAKVARPVVLGIQNLVTTAPIGTPFTPDIQLDFSNAPYHYNPGEIWELCCTPLIAYTIAANQEIILVVTPFGYWE